MLEVTVRGSTIVGEHDRHGVPHRVGPEVRGVSLEIRGNGERAREVGPRAPVRRLLGMRRPAGIRAHRHRRAVAAEVDEGVPDAPLEDGRFRGRHDAIGPTAPPGETMNAPM